MISLTAVFLILIIHFIADFVLQTDKQAKGKSKNWSDLLSHTYTYSCIWLIPVMILFPNGWSTSHYVLASLTFGTITFVCHTITDYFTSRLNSKLWSQATFWQNSFNKEKYGEDYCSKMSGKYTHNFFVSVGFDQLLHYTQLLLTYWFLTN